MLDLLCQVILLLLSFNPWNVGAGEYPGAHHPSHPQLAQQV